MDSLTMPTSEAILAGLTYTCVAAAIIVLIVALARQVSNRCRTRKEGLIGIASGSGAPDSQYNNCGGAAGNRGVWCNARPVNNRTMSTISQVLRGSYADANRTEGYRGNDGLYYATAPGKEGYFVDVVDGAVGDADWAARNELGVSTNGLPPYTQNQGVITQLDRGMDDRFRLMAAGDGLIQGIWDQNLANRRADKKEGLRMKKPAK